MSVRSVHFDFPKHLKLHPVPGHELANGFLVVRFLAPKLVARERKHLEPPRVQQIVQLYEFRIIARGQTSFGRHVHDQQTLPLNFDNGTISSEFRALADSSKMDLTLLKSEPSSSLMNSTPASISAESQPSIRLE